jgi:Fe2+ transport system protein B
MLDPDLAVIAATHDRRSRTLTITGRKTIDLIISTLCCAPGQMDDREIATNSRRTCPLPC